MKRTQVLSYGGGWQSVFICHLIIRGILPKPDMIIMSNTGREKSTTFEYLDKHMNPALAEIEMQVQVIDAARFLSKSDLDVINEASIKIPAKHESGVFRTLCSDRWKKNVIRRFLRSFLRSEGVEYCDMWLGFSRDEIGRAKQSDVKWAKNVFPLVDSIFLPNSPLKSSFISDYATEKNINLAFERKDIPVLLDQWGVPKPEKSSCYMCPHMTDDEWLTINDTELRRAIAIEKRIQSVDALDNMPYLHELCIPIEDVVKGLRSGQLKPKQRRNSNGNCQSGMCFI